MWRIELFGEPNVTGFGQIIRRFGSRRAVALLAFLALHPRTRHPREVLADSIWPEASHEAARNSLKQALASLRRLLEPPGLGAGAVFDADRSSIGLVRDSYVLDVDEFRAAAQSGDLLRASTIRKGELLPGFYDEWLDDIRLEIESLVSVLPAPEGEPEMILEEPATPLCRKELPGILNSVVGREQTAEQVRDLLRNHRWVTLTGLGGIGKTTLAVTVGRSWDGGDCIFVPLSEITDPSQIGHEAARRVGVDPTTAGGPIRALASALRGRPMLLILDNLEQISAPCRVEAIQELLEAIAELRILATSRIPLGGSGELDLPIYPLPIPSEAGALDELGSNPSVRLFVDRARLARADFQVTDRNADAMREASRLLEGVPLAIELCAAWTQTLSPQQLVERLKSQHDLLVARRAQSHSRHTSLQEAFWTSCSLLEPRVRKFLGKLSVFRGGWDLELAAEVTKDPKAVAKLAALIECALVIPDHSVEPPRCTMLESLRQVAEDLLAPDELEQTSLDLARHMAELARLSASNAPLLSRAIQDQSGWVRLVRSEWANFRAAAETLLVSEPMAALQMTLHLEWQWATNMSGDEPLIWLRRAIERLPQDSPEVRLARVVVHARSDRSLTIEESAAAFESLISEAEEAGDDRSLGEALLRYSQFMDIRRTRDRMLVTALAAVDVFDRIGHKGGWALSHYVASNWHVLASNEEEGLKSLSLAKAAFQETGDFIRLAACHYVQARLCYQAGRNAESLIAAEECLEMARSAGDERLVARTSNYCHLCLKELGESAQGRVYLMQSVQAFAECGDWAGAHYPLWNLALSLREAGRPIHAALILSASVAIWESCFGGQLYEEEAADMEAICAEAKAAAGELRFLQAWTRGKGAPPSEVVRLCREAVAADAEALGTAIN